MGMKAEAYALADKLDNECEPYVPLDEIIFIKAAKMLRQQADEIQYLKSQLIYQALENKLTGNNH
jgi:hypothetical protein